MMARLEFSGGVLPFKRLRWCRVERWLILTELELPFFHRQSKSWRHFAVVDQNNVQI